MTKPKLTFNILPTETTITVHFKNTRRAVRFASKLYKKPPKGVIKIPLDVKGK